MSILNYGVGEWDADTLGNHRVVIQVDEPAEAVQVHIPWRRRDEHPEKKALILFSSSTGARIDNLVCLECNREYADIVFQPIDGPGLYNLYFMPYTGSVRAPYPEIRYIEPEEAASPEWVAAIGALHLSSRPAFTLAEVLEIQSIDALSSFYPMEVIATSGEVKELVDAYPQKHFFLFPEERAYPIRMSGDLPYRWIEKGPDQPYEGKASRGEFYTFQIGVFAARMRLAGIRLEFTYLQLADGQAVIPSVAFHCFNLGGVDWTGHSFQKMVILEQGTIQALWCGILVPENTIPGTYTGEVRVLANGAQTEQISLLLEVLPNLIKSHGDDEPEKLSRLRWLDSTIALDDEVTSPFSPIEVEGNTIKILGRDIEIGADGFPMQIRSFFSPEMTHLQAQATSILAGPITLFLEDETRQVCGMQLIDQTSFTHRSDGRVTWKSGGQAGTVYVVLKAELEFDGNLEYSLSLRAMDSQKLSDVRLEVRYVAEVAQYMLGLGVRGGYRPSSYDWKWDVAHKNQDSLWLGSVNAGMQITLKNEHYQRPLNTNFYTLKPLISPECWDNSGNGGIRIEEENDQVVLVQCFSGPRNMTAGETLTYKFRLAITPFKPIDPEAQWATRYFHQYRPVEEVAETGANTINVHHANEINPFINYPFLRTEAMKAYIDQAHTLDMKVKIYYTVRELTNHAPELFALRSLGAEVLSDGPGGGHSWLQEHLVSSYVTGWHVHGLKDVAVVNSGASRWHNFYLEGLDWLARNIGIDGLYIDDVAFDRVVMQRVRKILDRRRPSALIDLHSANQFRERDGYANSANLYMEHFPYLNRLWFGEYFDYSLQPEFWLVEVSGIPFGLMGEMLQDGGNPWRGMLYGMTGRMPWSGDPRSLWKAWDDFGIQESQMIGYWSPNCPVKTGRPDILATVFQKNNQALIAIASWAPGSEEVRLQIDWAALGINSSHRTLLAPSIDHFQEPAEFSPEGIIPVEPGKGWLLILK